jgi:hypothetical protein
MYLALGFAQELVDVRQFESVRFPIAPAHARINGPTFAVVPHKPIDFFLERDRTSIDLVDTKADGDLGQDRDFVMTGQRGTYNLFLPVSRTAAEEHFDPLAVSIPSMATIVSPLAAIRFREAFHA